MNYSWEHKSGQLFLGGQHDNTYWNVKCILAFGPATILLEFSPTAVLTDMLKAMCTDIHCIF